MKLDIEVGLGLRQIVLNGDPAPLHKGAQPLPTKNRPCLLWSNGWMDQDAAWYRGRPQPRPHCARWDPASPPPKGHSPQFSAHACYGETAGWIKMPLRREVCLSPGHIVARTDPPPLPQRDTCPQFWPMSIVAKRSPISATAEHLITIRVRYFGAEVTAQLCDIVYVGSGYTKQGSFSA